MAITKPPVLPAWADTAANPADIVQPTNPEISAGWPSSTTPPSRQRFNWILHFCANAVRYFSRRGVADYDAAETYMTGDIVRGDNGLLYRSLQDNNINRLPSDAGSAAWWGSPAAPTAAGADNTTKIATTAHVKLAISGKADTNGNYPTMTVGNATNAAGAAVAASAGQVPWSGVTGKPTTVGGFGITDAITTGNIAAQSVNFANTAGRAYPYRWDGVEFRVFWSGQGGQPNWLLGSNDGVNWFVYNPSNFSVNAATNASLAVTQPLGSSGPQIATTEFVNRGALIGNNGYQRLPSGLILQWGRTFIGDIPGNPSFGTGVIVFPLAFPNAALSVQTTVQEVVDAVISGVHAFSSTQFTWCAREVVGRIQGATIHWFAIGF